MVRFRLSFPRVSVKSASAFWPAVILVSAIFLAPTQVAASTGQDDVMTNQTVIDLVKEKASDNLIIQMIQLSTKTKFDTSAKAVLALKRAGVSDAVIQAMMAKGADKPATDPEHVTSNPPPATEATPTPTDLPTEIGVYLKKDNQWVEVQPEVVNWKTGGVLKSIATVGIVKGDVNGRINGPHSRNYVKAPAEFLVIAREGEAITEYQFLRLREKKDAREFRTVTGGVFHQSGGANRDLVSFEGTKIAPRTFLVTLPALAPGEYGFLPPSAFTSAGASSSLGKMYTFRLTDQGMN